MPVEFLSDEQVGAYGGFTGELSVAEVERFFYLDDADRDLIARRRSDHHRLGFAVQLGTVRAVGRFLEDPLDVPWPAVEFLAEQLGIGDASCVKKYVQRPQTPYEHAWEIRDRYGYRSFDDPGCAGAFARFLEGRAWTHAEGPVALFEQAAGWLRRNRVLLPGVTVLARQVAAARETAEARVYAALAAATRSVDPGLPERLANLLQAPLVSQYHADALYSVAFAAGQRACQADETGFLPNPRRLYLIVAIRVACPDPRTRGGKDGVQSADQG